MKNIPALRARKVAGALRKAGFILLRQRGSHQIYQKGNRLLVIPWHSKDLKKPTVKAIIDQSGMTVEEFIKLL